MAYLVRRLLENTANDSFLRQTFVEGAAVDELVRPPQTSPDFGAEPRRLPAVAAHGPAGTRARSATSRTPTSRARENREAYDAALASRPRALRRALPAAHRRPGHRDGADARRR